MRQRTDLLVVDDEPVLLDAVRKICESEGLTIEEAATGEAGLDKLSRNRYGLALYDLMLPGIGGIELIDCGRRDAPRMPVVMMTGYATQERTVECFRHGAFDVIPKPFDVYELLATVRRALGFAELEDSLRRSVSLEEFRRECEAAGGGPTDLYSLGQHAWVSLEKDGLARIGVGESFRSVCGDVRSVKLPGIAGEVLQCNECASITTVDGLVHRVWSPVSGRVMETNEEWRNDFPGAGAFSDRWLIGAVPSDLESELDKLTRR